MAARVRRLTPSAEAALHPVMIELWYAKAARWLLGELHDGELGIIREVPAPLDGEEVREWLQVLCMRELGDALKRAEDEFLKMGAQPGAKGDA